MWAGTKPWPTTNSSLNTLNSTTCCRTYHFFSLWSWFEVFNKTPAGELIEANCHARLNWLKRCCLMRLPSFSSIIKSYHISYTKKINRITDCCNKEQHRSKTLSSLCVTVTDDVLKLGYTSVIFVDLGSQGRWNLLLWLASVTIVAACHTSCL